MVNIGVGPSNAKTITDHIAVLRPHAWLMLGHCAGLRNTQALGDYVLAHGYVREDHVLDDDLPVWVPIPPLAEVQVALEEAVAEVTGLEGYELKRIMRTGTVATIDNRNWELRDQRGPVQRAVARARAIALDMESATIAANGFRFRVPYGTLLCVSRQAAARRAEAAGHGDRLLPARRSTSTCASASARWSCCASTAWTSCTAASSAASRRWRSSSGRYATRSSASCACCSSMMVLPSRISPAAHHRERVRKVEFKHLDVLALVRLAAAAGDLVVRLVLGREEVQPLGYRTRAHVGLEELAHRADAVARLFLGFALMQVSGSSRRAGRRRLRSACRANCRSRTSGNGTGASARRCSPPVVEQDGCAVAAVVDLAALALPFAVAPAVSNVAFFNTYQLSDSRSMLCTRTRSFIVDLLGSWRNVIVQFRAMSR